MRGGYLTIICVIVLGLSFASSSDKLKPIVVPTTTDLPTTFSTSDIPTTTTSETTTPKTTTPKTTTTTPETTTTTPETTSKSTTILPTTTNVPTTVGPATDKTWNVTDGNVTCIIAELQARFYISDSNETLTLPSNAEVSYPGSFCNLNNTERIVLTFNKIFSLELEFIKDSETVSVKDVSFSLSFMGAQKVFQNDTELFPVKYGHSYLCRSTMNISLTDEKSNDTITLEISNFQFQAFRTELGENFGTAEECAADEKISDIVPIAVACALAVLIVIVLIAYLVGRRRSHQKGYSSV